MRVQRSMAQDAVEDYTPSEDHTYPADSSIDSVSHLGTVDSAPGRIDPNRPSSAGHPPDHDPETRPGSHPASGGSHRVCWDSRAHHIVILVNSILDNHRGQAESCRSAVVAVAAAVQAAAYDAAFLVSSHH